MKIILNGQSHDISDNMSLAQLLDHLGLSMHALAVAVNSEIIPRSRLEATFLKADDQVDLVQAVGGG